MIPRKYIEKLVWFTTKHYIWVLVLACLVTAFSAYLTSRLHVSIDLQSLLPDDYASVKQMKAIGEKIGRGEGNVVVVIESESPDASLAFADDLTEVLSQKQYVNRVDHRIDHSFFKANRLLFLDMDDLIEIRDRIKRRIDKEKLERNPFYINLEEDDEAVEAGQKIDWNDIEAKYYKGERKLKQGKGSEIHEIDDGKVVGIQIIPNSLDSDLAYAKWITEEITSECKKLNPASYDSSLQFGLAGSYKNMLDQKKALDRDIYSSITVSLLGVYLILCLYFRRFLAVLFIAVPMVMGIIWTFGMTYLVIGGLNMVTAFLFAILFGLSIDYGIHMLGRYLEEREKNGVEIVEALITVLHQTGGAAIITAMTTAAAFYMLMITDFKGFSEFGAIAGNGILLCLTAMYFVFPPLIIFGEKTKILNVHRRLSFIPAFRIGRLPAYKSIILAGFIFTAICIYMAPRVEFEYNFRKLRADLKTSQKWKNMGYQLFTESFTPAVTMASSQEELKEAIKELEFRAEHDVESPTIDHVTSLFSFVPDQQEKRFEILADIKRLLKDDTLKLIKEKEKRKLDDLSSEISDLRPLTQDDIPEYIKKRFRAGDGSLGHFAVIYPRVDVQLSDGRNALKFAEDIQKIETPAGTFYSSSSAIIIAEIIKLLFRDAEIAIGASLLAVFIILLIDLRSFRKVVLVLTPLLCAFIWLLGFMFISDMKINFYNIVVLPAIFGIGIDDIVHLYHRYNEEGPGSLEKVLNSTGGAIVATTLTTLVGFSGLAFTWHAGLQSMGDLAIIGLTLCLITSILFFPAILLYYEERSMALCKVKEKTREEFPVFISQPQETPAE